MQTRSPVIKGGMPARSTVKALKRTKSKLATAYLILYNAISAGSWLCFAYHFVHALQIDGWNAESMFTKSLSTLCWVQTLATIEVVHAICHLTPSSPLATAIQITSRLVIVWPICHILHAHWGFALIAIAWTISDALRYIYYLANLIGVCPRWLSWCRYTFFVGLYPLGTLGEMALIKSTMSVLDHLQSPYKWVIGVLLVVWPIGFGYMYVHMLKQRQKYIALA